VDEVSLTVRYGRLDPVTTRLTRDRVAVARRLIKKPIKAHTTIEGSLRMVDDTTLECRVERAPAVSVTCLFEERDRDVVWEAGKGRRFVRVVGEGDFHPDEKEPRKVWASSIEILYEEHPFDSKMFWQHRALSELAAEQGVQDQGVSELEDPWRDDEEADALIAAIEGRRRAT
jgi:hypothetical protein